MQAWRCHAKVEVSTDEWEQVGCGEAVRRREFGKLEINAVSGTRPTQAFQMA